MASLSFYLMQGGGADVPNSVVEVILSQMNDMALTVKRLAYDLLKYPLAKGHASTQAVISLIKTDAGEGVVRERSVATLKQLIYCPGV